MACFLIEKLIGWHFLGARLRGISRLGPGLRKTPELLIGIRQKGRVQKGLEETWTLEDRNLLK